MYPSIVVCAQRTFPRFAIARALNESLLLKLYYLNFSDSFYARTWLILGLLRSKLFPDISV
jgi:hypothetical protein